MKKRDWIILLLLLATVACEKGGTSPEGNEPDGKTSFKSTASFAEQTDGSLKTLELVVFKGSSETQESDEAFVCAQKLESIDEVGNVNLPVGFYNFVLIANIDFAQMDTTGRDHYRSFTIGLKSNNGKITSPSLPEMFLSHRNVNIGQESLVNFVFSRIVSNVNLNVRITDAVDLPPMQAFGEGFSTQFVVFRKRWSEKPEHKAQMELPVSRSSSLLFHYTCNALTPTTTDKTEVWMTLNTGAAAPIVKRATLSALPINTILKGNIIFSLEANLTYEADTEILPWTSTNEEHTIR